MRQLGDGLFEVPSDTNPNNTYIVNLTGAYPQCTCTAWAFNRNRAKTAGTVPKPCKHCNAVMRMDQTAWADMKAKQEEAIAEAQRAKEAEEQAKRDKMRAELLKMRADLSGEPAPASGKPAKAATPVSAPKTDLLGELEAAIEAQKESK